MHTRLHWTESAHDGISSDAKDKAEAKANGVRRLSGYSRSTISICWLTFAVNTHCDL